MARQRYQRGCVFQRGKRRKVWVGRWRERVLQVDGMIGQVQRSVVLGRVADLPTRRLAQAALDERVGPINRGLHVPQSVATFGEFAERDWKRLVLPTLKLSTQRSYRMMLQKHLVPYWREWRLCDITKIDVQQFVLRKFDQQLAWQTDHAALQKAGQLTPLVFYRLVAKGRGGPKSPKRIKALTKAWQAACIAAGCPGRIPHDLRRSAVRTFVRAGISETVAMKLSGHLTPSVFRRYDITSDADLREAAARLDRDSFGTVGANCPSSTDANQRVS